PKLDLQTTQIPPMLIQPLIENAIKHGANKAKDTGIINIQFEQISPEGYQCIVEDNGPGIAPESKSTHKSRGLEMIYTRIQLLNEEFGATAFAFAVSNKIKPESGARMEIQFKMSLEY
ncbi:MAG: hypothetical protein PHX54_13055, partial [Lentimicrobiaceae bacterium]|nr:hypothetical protein [Lentimicrobiaceae bacterium]